mmetsp:Transcript_16248/g.35263  ORF Transcript_16248/g.35263 Transcript_16248/m.35263 type:complete len:604 (+) Transcript_16248:70-1881(+)
MVEAESASATPPAPRGFEEGEAAAAAAADMDEEQPQVGSDAVEAAEQADVGEEEEAVEEVPEQKFQVRQRVFARDEKASGILYESVVRRAMYGMRQKQINVYLVDPSDPDAGKLVGQDEDDEEYCWHYFVHYQGWNVKWDRWVEEDSLYVASDASRDLAKVLKTELDKIVKLQKQSGGGGRGGNDINVVRRRMAQLEAEFREEERRDELRKQGLLPPLSEEEATKKDDEAMDKEETGDDAKGEVKGEEESTKDKADSEQPTEKEPEASKQKTKYTKAVLEKERKLRKKCLEGKLWRKQTHAQKIVLPFTLKKIMVEEWEIISLCGMVPKLPADVTIKKALDQFLESKLEVLRPATSTSNPPEAAAEESTSMQTDSSAAGASSDTEEKKDDAATVEASEIEAMEIAELEAMAEDEETTKKKREWMDVVTGVVQFFDEALPVHLLYEGERMHHKAVMRSDDPLLEDKLPSEIYGCEYLLRMFVQFPTLLSESGLPESDAKTILSKMNDLLRFLQKHQSEFFSQTYRKPEGKELKKRIPRKKKPAIVAEDKDNGASADVGADGNNNGGNDGVGNGGGNKRSRTSCESSAEAADTPPKKVAKTVVKA